MAKNKDDIIFILEWLNKGNVEPRQLLNVFTERFSVTERTFWKKWKKAKESYFNQAPIIKDANLRDKTKQLAIENIKAIANIDRSEIADRHERMVVATKILRGQGRMIKIPNGSGGYIEEYVYPTPSDQLKALDYLSKVEGDYLNILPKNTEEEDPVTVFRIPDNGRYIIEDADFTIEKPKSEEKK